MIVAKVEFIIKIEYFFPYLKKQNLHLYYKFTSIYLDLLARVNIKNMFMNYQN